MRTKAEMTRQAEIVRTTRRWQRRAKGKHGRRLTARERRAQDRRELKHFAQFLVRLGRGRLAAEERRALARAGLLVDPSGPFTTAEREALTTAPTYAAKRAYE